MPVAHYAAESQKKQEISALVSEGSSLSLKIQPVHFTLSSEGISGITLTKGSEKITITFDDIWEALK